MERRRPRGIRTIAVLALLISVFNFLCGAECLYESIDALGQVLGGGLLAIGALLLAFGIGVLRYRPWVWSLGVVVVGIETAIVVIDVLQIVTSGLRAGMWGALITGVGLCAALIGFLRLLLSGSDMRRTRVPISCTTGRGDSPVRRTMTQPANRARDARATPARRTAASIFIVLTALLVPLLLAIFSLPADYFQIRTLGEDGLHHLLAAESDLIELRQLPGLLDAFSGPADSGAAVFDELDEDVLAETGTTAPYTLLVQRQAGTFYSTQVSIQPSPTMQQAGIHSVHEALTLDTNTAFSLATSGSSAQTPTRALVTPRGSGSARTTQMPEPTAFDDAQAECTAAEQDFQALQARLENLGWAISLATGLPTVGANLSMVHALVIVGTSAATLCERYTGAVIPLLAKLQRASLNANQALLSQSDLDAVETTIAQSQPVLNTLVTTLDQLNVNDLPLPQAQKVAITAAKAALPKLRTATTQALQYLNAIGWLLGTDHSRKYLVETLDSTEMRASGGFSGDFGIVDVQGGKIAPISLAPVTRIDYSGKPWFDGWDIGRRPPASYSWWPIPQWGLRDSNLSADFPTTAQLAMMVYQGECGASCKAAGLPSTVDGVIQITPVAIEHILQLTGPLTVPDFRVTVTADNLEYEIHYFSLRHADGSYPPGPNGGPFTDRKTFFYEFGRLMEERIRSLPSHQFLALARAMLQDVKSKDIQLYVVDPTTENLLKSLSLAGAVEAPHGQDTALVVQTNVTAAKANPCVLVTQSDQVALDDQGGATHHLTITMHHIGGAGTPGNCDPWYQEYPTYHAYMRIYAPASARLQSADGFDQEQRLCPANCLPNPYPGGELSCRAGGYDPGVHTPNVVPMGAGAGVLDRVGGPTQRTSDVPGTTMWGGFVVIPPNCTAHLVLAWYVPGVVHWRHPSSPTSTTLSPPSPQPMELAIPEWWPLTSLSAAAPLLGTINAGILAATSAVPTHG
jgi:hypothetical protein